MRGWCPTVHEPMATGDGLLARVKPPGGVVSAAAMRALADAAERYGNGVVELTSRAGLQVRGLREAGPFAAVMVDAGLACAEPGWERRRNVIGTPLAGVDPGVDAATGSVVAALEAALADGALAGLPAKFGFVVDGGGVLPMTAPADVSIRLRGDWAEVAGVRVAVADAVGAAIDLARRCGSLRMRLSHRRSPEVRRVGAHAVGAFGAGSAFGSTDAGVLRGVADVAEAQGDGVIRLSPWRVLFLAGSEGMGAALGGLGLIVDPEDPVLRVSACPGMPACGSASVATRAVARRLRPGAGVSVHVSGCGKGCAHSGAADVTWVGREGRFDLVRDGRAGDAPVRLGVAAAEIGT